MINNLKGHMIHDDAHVFGRKYSSWLWVITNIKIIGLKDQILLLLQLGDGDISRLRSSPPNLHLRSPLTHVQNFYPEVESFIKNVDKFG